MIKLIHKIIVSETNNLKLSSSVIAGKQIDGAIFIYDMLTNDKNLENCHQGELEKKLNNSLNYDYNGILVFIPKKHQDNFISFVETYMLEQYNSNVLDFNHGSMSEAVGIHYLEKGLLVELVYASSDKDTFIDGIYNRGIFNDLLNNFYEQEDIWEDEKESVDLTRVFSYRNNRMLSALQTREGDSAEKAKFYDLIKNIQS